MNVSLTPELERMIEKKVATGRYSSASEVVREALRLLEEREKLQRIRLQQLRRDLDVGIEQLDHGMRTPFDTAAIKRIRKRGRQLLSSQRKKRG